MIGQALHRKARSERLVANAKQLVTRRQTLANEFRASLLAELPPSDSVVRQALVESAVSAYVEISEISAAFQRGKANESALTRLGLARGQLARLLKALGAGQTHAAADDEVETPAQWLARQTGAGSNEA